jgi:hypothetical protein
MKFLVKFEREKANTNASAGILEVRLFGSRSIHDELIRLENTQPVAYGRLMTYHEARFTTGKVITTYKYLYAHGMTPLVDTFVLEEMQRDRLQSK